MPNGPEIWAAVIALALVSTVIAYILFFRLLATAGPTNLSLVTFLVPITAIILGTLRFSAKTWRPSTMSAWR